MAGGCRCGGSQRSLRGLYTMTLVATAGIGDLDRCAAVRAPRRCGCEWPMATAIMGQHTLRLVNLTAGSQREFIAAVSHPRTPVTKEPSAWTRDSAVPVDPLRFMGIMELRSWRCAGNRLAAPTHRRRNARPADGRPPIGPQPVGGPRCQRRYGGLALGSRDRQWP